MNIGDKINCFTFFGLDNPRIETNKPRKMGIFMCDCGFTKSYDYSQVKLGSIKMCFGCASKLRGKMKFKHGLIKHTLYRKWQDLKKRCYNKKVDRYCNYGKRGIQVCAEWKNDFKSFYEWSINNGWKEGLEIERINNDGDYCPDNCKFITHEEQSFNKSTTRYLKINGENVCLTQVMKANGKSNNYNNAHHYLVYKNKGDEFIINKFNLKWPVIQNQ